MITIQCGEIAAVLLAAAPLPAEAPVQAPFETVAALDESALERVAGTGIGTETYRQVNEDMQMAQWRQSGAVAAVIMDNWWAVDGTTLIAASFALAPPTG